MKWIISFLLGVVAGIVAHSYAVSGRVFSGADASRVEVRTTVVERRDTTVVRVPVVRERRVVDTLWVWADGTNRTDGTNRLDSSAAVGLPVEQRVYEDSSYTAWVSGVEPRLDSIQVYGRVVERETVREVVREVERRGEAQALFGGRLFGGRLGVGVFGGVGIGGSSGMGVGAGPVVGVGLTYNFLCL